ncbi:MAG: hypothetical protein IPK07_08955 [Deltaproteobacteria bacterium]|nr:hypothetical protein [Deltaproteobacteria bacterium]
MTPQPPTPPPSGGDYKLTLYGSCPGCGQFAGKIEWQATGFRALRDRLQRETPNGFCAACRLEFPLTWAQVRLRGRMIREGEVAKVLLADDAPAAR